MPKTVLMCPPTYFDIEYEINPWMHTNNQVVPKEAKNQWQKLYDTYVQKLSWGVEIIEPVKGLPDMVFTANGGMVYKDKVILPRFRHSQRQDETQYFKRWFENAGYQSIYMPKYNFEGEGDGFVWRDEIFFGGYGFRSDQKVHQEIAGQLDLKPVSLKLVDPRFYHLDTCFTIINKDTVAIYPKAFDNNSLATLKKMVPNLIEATDADALVYGLNAQVDEEVAVIPKGAHNLVRQYKKLGLKVYEQPIGEFQKSGGGVKCLTLDLG